MGFADRGHVKDYYWRGYLHGKDPSTAAEFQSRFVMEPRLNGKGAEQSVAAGIPGASADPVPEETTPRGGKPEPKPHKSTFEFEGVDDEDLPFAKGAIIMVTSKGDSDGEGRDGQWWKGYVHGKPERVGQFPSSYVEEYSGALPGAAPAPAPPTAPAPAPAPAPPAAPAPAPASDPDGMPAGLTKMQQLLWRVRHSRPFWLSVAQALIRARFVPKRKHL